MRLKQRIAFAYHVGRDLSWAICHKKDCKYNVVLNFCTRVSGLSEKCGDDKRHDFRLPVNWRSCSRPLSLAEVTAVLCTMNQQPLSARKPNTHVNVVHDIDGDDGR